MKQNKELEKQLREEWGKYCERSHPEDAMSFIDYVYNISTFKGHEVTVDESGYGDIKILFNQNKL